VWLGRVVGTALVLKRRAPLNHRWKLRRSRAGRGPVGGSMEAMSHAQRADGTRERGTPASGWGRRSTFRVAAIAGDVPASGVADRLAQRGGVRVDSGGKGTEGRERRAACGDGSAARAAAPGVGDRRALDRAQLARGGDRAGRRAPDRRVRRPREPSHAQDAGCRPIDRLCEESAVMTPLPATPPDATAGR